MYGPMLVGLVLEDGPKKRAHSEDSSQNLISCLPTVSDCLVVRRWLYLEG